MAISAIIPAYNEEKTIANVIETLMTVKEIDEIIVVSDGSKDATASIAKGCGCKLIELPMNKGKGGAVKSGLEKCTSDIVLFLDADLVGLKAEHAISLLFPLIHNEADMSVGVFAKGRLSTDLAQKIVPCLSGQRAVRKSVLEDIEDLEWTGYGVEVAITRHVEQKNIRVVEVELHDLTHIMKEEKLGLIRGGYQRLRMYWHIYRQMRRQKIRGNRSCKT